MTSAQSVIVENLHIIGDLVENVLEEITQTKKLCHDCVKDYIDIALWLFPIYVQDSKMCEELFNFFYIVFDVLKSCMGASKVEAAIQVFLSLFTKEQLVQVIITRPRV